MRIVDIKFGPDPNISAMVDSLRKVVLTSARMPMNTDWRDADMACQYREYKTSVGSSAKIAELVRCKLEAKEVLIERNPFPQSKLEKIFPGFLQFTLWSSHGQLCEPDVSNAFEGEFPGRERVVFWNDGFESIPQFWHVHGMIYLARQVQRLI